MDVKYLLSMYSNASSEEEKQRMRNQHKKVFDALSPEDKKEAQKIFLECWDAKLDEVSAFINEKGHLFTEENILQLASVVKDYRPKFWQSVLQNSRAAIAQV